MVVWQKSKRERLVDARQAIGEPTRVKHGYCLQVKDVNGSRQGYLGTLPNIEEVNKLNRGAWERQFSSWRN